MFLSSFAFFILLSLLILIHEWGHFAAARKAKVTVEEFGFGLPPRAKTLFTQGGTKFSLNWIPFGGFVRLKGDNAIEEKEYKAKGSFGGASIPWRIIILCGGVFMNFILALIILTIGFAWGQWVPTYSLEELEQAKKAGILDMTLSVRITEMSKDGTALKAGVPQGAIITHVDDQEVVYPEQVSAYQEGKNQVEYTLKTGENFQEEQKMIVPLVDGKSGVSLTSFPQNISSGYRGIHTAIYLALRESWVMLKNTTYGIGHLFYTLITTGKIPEGITGIVGIAQMTHDSIQQGFMPYLRLIAFLSLSLAALNILPFPALDGGRLLFIFAEAIARRPINRKVELITNSIGFIFLVILILLITYHDIVRIFFS